MDAGPVDAVFAFVLQGHLDDLRSDDELRVVVGLERLHVGVDALDGVAHVVDLQEAQRPVDGVRAVWSQGRLHGVLDLGIDVRHGGGDRGADGECPAQGTLTRCARGSAARASGAAGCRFVRGAAQDVSSHGHGCLLAGCQEVEMIGPGLGALHGQRVAAHPGEDVQGGVEAVQCLLQGGLVEGDGHSGQGDVRPRLGPVRAGARRRGHSGDFRRGGARPQAGVDDQVEASLLRYGRVHVGEGGIAGRERDGPAFKGVRHHRFRRGRRGGSLPWLHRCGGGLLLLDGEIFPLHCLVHCTASEEEQADGRDHG